LGVEEDLRVDGAIDRVSAEQPAEQEHLGQQEDPHPKLAGVELLLGRVEMMGQRGRVLAGVVGVLRRLGVRHGSIFRSG